MKNNQHLIIKKGLLGLTLALGLSLSTLSFAQDLKNTIRMAYMGEPASLDPHKVSGTWENAIMTQLFLGLFTNDKDENTILGTVASYEVSPDGLVYTFKLRDDAKWSDGTPLVAEDYVYSWKRIADPKVASPYATFMSIVEGIDEFAAGTGTEIGAKALDDKTLQVTLRAPAPYFTQLLVHYASYAVPKQAIEKHGNEWTKPQNFVGNGAYKLVEWRPNTHIKMTKNPEFYDVANVKIENIIFYSGEDRSSWLKRFRAGEVDYVDDLPEDQLPKIKVDLKNEFREGYYAGVYFYAINNKKPPFDDVRVRQALNMGFSREILTEKVLKGGWTPAYSFVPKGIKNYEGGPAEFTWKDLSQADKDAKAKELLAEAGFGPNNPLKFTMSYNTSDNHKRVAIAMAQMWKKLGIEVELFNQEVTPHYDALKQKNYDLGRAGWIADYSDPQTFLYLLETKTGQQNYNNYSNPKFDQLMDDATKLIDLKARAQVLKQAEQVILDDAATMPVMYYAKFSLLNKRIKNMTFFSLGANPVRWLEIVE